MADLQLDNVPVGMNNTSSNQGIKLLIIGLDGATWDVIKPLLAGGELPNLARLMNNGTSGDLKSTVPPFSAPAWATFMTGMNPGKHGIFGFINFNPQSYSQIDSRMVTSSPLVGHTIFDALSQSNYRLAVISVPITYPAWPINGFMVSGEPCPDTQKGMAYPEAFADSLIRRYAFHSTFWSKPNEEIINGLYDMDDSRTELAINLILEENLDALMLVFGGTDRVQHNFWRFYDTAFGDRLGLPNDPKYASTIPETYRRADDAIGRILSHVGDNTLVLVISDHGGGPAATKFFHTNAWLQRQEFLQVIRGRDGLVNRTRGPALALRRVFDTPLGSRVRIMLPTRLVNQGRALVRNIAQIDWPRSRAYRFPMYPPNEGIVINLAGRQSQGIVKPNGDYDCFRRQIIEQVSRVTDPETGDQVVEQAYLREQLYNGPHIERAPDIVLVLKEDYSGGTSLHPPLTTSVDPNILMKVNGEHRMQGIILACGPMIKKKNKIEGAELVDLAPTLLYSLGLPIKREMDGLVLKELFTPEFLSANPEPKVSMLEEGEVSAPETPLTPEEEEQMKEQLKRLGYL